tara:strand:- start:271 stop:609 length:339 start_codon:yes stop_codon:yes gene_type:complete
MIKLDKSNVVNINKFVLPSVYAVVTAIDNGLFVLEALNQFEIEAASKEGFELFFNKLPSGDFVDDSYDQIVLRTIKAGGDIKHITTRGESIVVIFSDTKEVFKKIDEVCATK